MIDFAQIELLTAVEQNRIIQSLAVAEEKAARRYSLALKKLGVDAGSLDSMVVRDPRGVLWIVSTAKFNIDVEIQIWAGKVGTRAVATIRLFRKLRSGKVGKEMPSFTAIEGIGDGAIYIRAGRPDGGHAEPYRIIGKEVDFDRP